MKTVAELEALWNAQADEYNQWSTLGLDEMIAFAQLENWTTKMDQAAEDDPQTEVLLEFQWNAEHGQQPAWSEISRGRKLAYAMERGRADAAREAGAATAGGKSSDYDDVMECLRDMQMPHGTCEPRWRRACTHCNAKERLQLLVDGWRGRPVRLAQQAAAIAPSLEPGERFDPAPESDSAIRIIGLLRQLEKTWPRESGMMIYANGNGLNLHERHPCEDGREIAHFSIPSDGGGDR